MAIGKDWASYRDFVIPPHAPNVQKLECERAFYAGAWSMFKNMMKAADLDEAQAEKVVATLEAEVENYARLTTGEKPQ
jgi:hypothetical protein